MKIPLIQLDEVDSTSSYIMNQVSGKSSYLPVAVMAKSQHCGRGRQGRNWDSPPGNLYLSLGFAADKVALSRLPLVPIHVAVLVSKWLQKEFGIRITLKWPNDLLFAGEKLGGILCEAVVEADKASALVIGIGLNVLSLPKMLGDLKASTLSEVLRHRSLDTVSIARSLCHSFEEYWQPQIGCDETALQQFARYSIEKGQLWVEPAANFVQYRYYNGLAKNGNMLLGKDGEPETAIHSVNHNQRWIYQRDGGEQYPLLVADLGNSRFKVGFYEKARQPGEPTQVLSGEYVKSDLGQLDILRHRLDELGFADGWPIHVASVHQKGSVLFREACNQSKFKVVEIPKREVRLRLDYELGQIGIDRLALMEGILDAGGYTSFIAVSAGTTITIDLVDEGNYHRGGWIIPGFNLQFKSMAQGTSQLPQLDDRLLRELSAPSASGLQLGHNTQEAMLNGVMGASRALIKALGAVNERAGKEPVVLVSGGSGKLLASSVDGLYDQNWILAGLRAMVLGGI